MDKQSVENMDEWFTLPVYDCMRVLGLESKGHLTQLQYLPLTNTIAGVTNEDCIVTFDASSGEPLQSFKIGCEIGKNLLLRYHNCTGSIVLCDGFSMGYRCQSNSLFHLKTMLQVPVASDSEFVAVELSISEAKLLLDVMRDNAILKTIDSSNRQCVNEMLGMIVKELSSHSEGNISTSTGCYPCKSTSKPFGKLGSIHFSMQHSVLRSACQSLLNCYDSKSTRDGLLEEDYHGQHHILDGMAVVSSTLNQLALLHNEEKSESATLPDPSKSVMCSEWSRRLSFSNWPHPNYRYAQPSTMAEAGFFHQPAADGDDRAICFACDVCLVCWEPTDEPWSEHERHSPLCPFVRCEPTLNVPIAITLARQPASPNPLLNHLRTRDNQIDFLCVGENSSLVVAASKVGNFIYWDASSGMPVLRFVSTLNKSDVLSELVKQIANETEDEAGNFPFQGDFHLEDLSVSSLCLIDSAEVQPTSKSTEMSPHMANAETDLELEHGDDATRSSLKLKQPVLAIGAVVKLTSSRPTQESAAEEMPVSLYYSLLIFATSESFSMSIHEEKLHTVHDALSVETVQPFDKHLSETESSNNDDYLADPEEKPHDEAHSGTNTAFYDAPYLAGSTSQMKVLQVVIIDHKESIGNDHKLRLQVLKNIAKTKDSTKLIATSTPEEFALTVASHNFSSDIVDSDTDNMHPRQCENSHERPSLGIGEKFGLVMAFNLMPSVSSVWLMPKSIQASNKGKTWIATPIIVQMIEMPGLLASATCSDEGDGNGATSTFSQAPTKSSLEPEAQYYFQPMEHPLMLMLGDDGLLRLFDVKLMKVVHEVKPDDIDADKKFTAITYCSSIDQVCAVTLTGKVSFLKIGRHPRPGNSVHGVSNDNARISLDSTASSHMMKSSPKEDDLIANHPLNQSNLETLQQLTKFLKLEPRFQAKTPSQWTELQLKELTNILKCPPTVEETFQTIPRKARMGQSNVSVQVKQQRRHLRHPNEHYAFDAHLNTRAWRLHHESSKQEIVELTFPHSTNISHIDLQFVLTQKLKSGCDVKVTLLSHYDSPRVKSTDGNSVGAVDGVHQRIDLLNSKPSSDDSFKPQYPNLERSDILFGPVLISEYVDPTGLGGVITIASKRLTRSSRHRSLLVLVENVSEGTLTSDHDNDERNRQFRNCACLQEVSITVFKSKRVDIIHESAQRLSLLHSRTLHAKLLSSLCHGSAVNGKFVSTSLSQKVMALDTLNWVAALEIADPNERSSTYAAWKNNSNVAEPMLQCQSLAHLLCFLESKEMSQSEFEGRNHSTDFENLDKSSHVKFNLTDFLINCFLKSGKDIGVRALRFIFHTILFMDATGRFQSRNTCGREILYKAILNSLKYAATTRVNSIYGIYCLYKILHATLVPAPGQTGMNIQIKGSETKLSDCVNLLAALSYLMEEHANPVNMILRSAYGLYTSPFDMAVMASDIGHQKSTGRSKLKFQNIPDDEYIGEEDVDMCAFMTPQQLDCHKALASCGISDEYYSTRLSCVECQPLHFNCIELSDGCTFGSGVATADNYPSFQNSQLAESAISNHKDIWDFYPWNHPESSLSEFKSSAYADDVLDCYADLETESSHSISASEIILQQSDSQTEDLGPQNSPSQDPENKLGTPQKPSESNALKELHTPDPKSKMNINYFIPVLSFMPPRPMQLTISRMHSGGRRSAILDFGHIIELSDISIPFCKSLSSFIIEAWPCNMKSCPTIDATDFFTIAISLDICCHDFTASPITPTVLTRYVRITAIGKYGTSNAQTVVSLGSFYGRPACIRLCAMEGTEQNHSKCTISPETVETPSHGGIGKRSNAEISAMRITDAGIVTDGVHAIECYLNSLQNYLESLTGQYALARVQLKSMISISSSNLSSFNAHIGNTYEIPSKQAVSQAYKKCTAIQLQLSRIHHAIALIESMNGSSQRESMKNSSESNQSLISPQIGIHCELMLNLLLSVCPQILKLKEQIRCDAVFSASSAEILFKYLIMGSPHPRIRAQATGVLLSCYAQFPNWGSFLVSCLTRYFRMAYSRNLSPSQSHFFCNILVLSQRCLAIPAKGEDVIESLMSLISITLPEAGELVEREVNFKLLTLVLLLVSHLTETIGSMNETFVLKSNPQIFPLILAGVSGTDDQGSFLDLVSPINVTFPSPEEAESLERIASIAKNYAKTHIGQQNLIKQVTDSYTDKLSTSGIKSSFVQETFPRSFSWDFMSLSGFQDKFASSVSHSRKILKWLYAVHDNLQSQRGKLEQLVLEECSLRKKINTLCENTVNDDDGKHALLENALSVISKKSSDCLKTVLGYRRTLDQKVIQSLLQSKPISENSKDPVEVPQSSSFIRVPVELCHRVVKQILALLLQHDIAIPADLVVLSCKVCSQLSYWATLQCINENRPMHTSPEDCKKYFSPLSLTNLLSSDQLTKLLLLSAGVHSFAFENVSDVIPTMYREGPWICYAFRNLLSDLLKYENLGLLSSCSDASDSTFDNIESFNCKNFDVTDANPMPDHHEENMSQTSKDSSPHKQEDWHDSRIKVVDNFIRLAEVLTTDVRFLVACQEADSIGGYGDTPGYPPKSMVVKPKKTKPPADSVEFVEKTDDDFLQKMREYYLQTTHSTGLWNSKSPESAAIIHPICSHVYDRRSVHGISRNILLTSKMYSISYMESVANSLANPPSRSPDERKEHGDFFKGCASTADCSKTAMTLRTAINRILDDFTDNDADFSAICDLILLIQHSYKSLASKCAPNRLTAVNAIGHAVLKKLLNIATADSLTICTDNLRLLNLILRVLNSFICAETDHATDADKAQKLLQHDFGMSNLFIKILSAKFGASCLGHAHAHRSLAILGPSVCASLERSFQSLQSLTANITVQDCLQVPQPAHTISEKLKLFYLNILSSLIQNSAFDFTLQTPVDGQVAFVKAILRLYDETSSEMTFVGDPTIITNIVDGISDLAIQYLSWSCINVNRNQSCKIVPSALFPNTSPEQQTAWLSNSPKDELMLNLLKLGSFLCKVDVVINREPLTQEPMSDRIFDEGNTIRNLLSALSISTGSTTIQDNVDNFLSKMQTSATTTCDGVLILLLSLFNSQTSPFKKIQCIMTFLKGANGHNRFDQQKILRRTSRMSYPVLTFFTQVLSSSGVLLDAFIAEGGVKLILVNLIASLNQGFDPRNSLVSQAVKYITAAPGRSEALNFNEPVQMQTEPSFPAPKGLESHAKLKKYYAYTKALADGLMFAPTPHSKLTANSWRTEEKFDFATIATVECSDPAAPPPDSLLKHKALHRRARTPVWSYHFQGNTSWVSLTLHFPSAFVLNYVKILTMIPSLSTCPSAVLLELNHSGIPEDSFYHPISTPLATSGMGDIILVPPTEEVVLSMKIFLKRPLDSSSIGLTRISVTGTSFISYKAPIIKPSSFMKINSTNFSASKDTGPNTSSSIWILLLYHLVRLHDNNVMQEIQRTSATVDEMVPTLCTLLELGSLPSISHAIETILLEVSVAAMAVFLIDCIFGKHGKAKYSHYLDKTSPDCSDYFVHIIYQMCILKDTGLQLRLKRCLYWITKTTQFAVTNDNLNAVNADFIHAISCGLWRCSDTETAKTLISESLLKNIYDSTQSISRSQISKSPSSHYSSRLKESLDWILCSLCQIDVNCYFSLLKWMNLNQNISKVVSLSISQIETLASTTQTKRTAEIFLNHNIMMLFANGLQQFCATQFSAEIDESNEVDAMVEVTPNNVVVILKFFSHLCNILPIQCWLGTEQGARCWRALLNALDHPMSDITHGSITGSLLMDVQESTVNLIKQITRCNQRNCEVVSSAICNMISSQSGKLRGRSSFSGFLRSLLFQVIMEDETVMVHIKSCSEENVQCNKVASNACDILRHPMFGTGHYNHVLDVGIMSSIENISSIVTGRHGASGKHERMHKNKEPVSKPEMNFQKSQTYAAISKSTNPVPGFSLSPGDLVQIHSSAKNAQDKRKVQTGNTQSPLPEDADQSEFLKVAFSCDELKLDHLDGANTLIQILERYHAQKTYPFFHCIQLEASCTLNASAVQGNSQAGNVDIDKSIPSKEKQNQRSKESDTRKILKTMFQVFAESGGFSLIACHLPSLTLDAGPMSVNDFTKAILTEDRRRVRTESLPYMDSVSEWMTFDDDDCLYAQFDDGPLIHPGVKMSIKDGLPKPKVPTRSSSDKQSSSIKCCVPSFTFTALRSFLQVPLFAEELLKDYSTAKCLMRLALGVMDDGRRQFCPSLTPASALSLLPFNALSRLLSEYDCSTPSGLMIREAMTFQTISLHTVVACISRYSHIEPTSDTTAGKLLKFVLSQGFSPHSTQKKSVTPSEKNYWAQGTGFGTGSTSSDWNPEDLMKEQKKDEEFLSIFIQILANFVCPASAFEAKAGHEITVTKCVSSNESLVKALTELVIASGLISAVASYLRNDSVLDISSHVTLYQALLSMIRSFSLCPPLSQLLVNWMPPTKDSSTTEDVAQESIADLLTKMKTCISTYSSRLEALNTNLDAHEDKEFSYFVDNVKNTEHMLRTIMQDSDENLHTQDEVINTLLQSPKSIQSLEEIYTNRMKELQFDTAILVQENEKGNYVFPSGHHYNALIKESSNVTDASRARRLAQEAVTLSNSLPLSLSSTVFVRCDEERLDVMKVLITGPVDTPYANGCFEFDVYFPTNYNKSPPLVNLRTTGNQSVRFNPNLYNDGKVCLSILNTWHGRPEERWNPQASSFLQILVSIQSLIFVKEPYFNEPGYERSRGTPSGQQCSLDYDANIQQATVKWAMLEQLKKPSGCFRHVILNHFWMKKDEILKQCDTWLANMKKRTSQQKSRKSIAQNYLSLQKYVSQLQTELRKLSPPPSHDNSEESDE